MLLILSLATLGCGGEFALLPSADDSGDARGRVPVVFLTDGAASLLPAEEAAALEWLDAHPEFEATPVELVDLSRVGLPRDAVLWWHWSQDAALPAAAVAEPALAGARRHLARGGSLLLTLLAAPWVAPLGLETSPPDRVAVGGLDVLPSDLGAPLGLGVQAFRGHPLLNRFWGGTETLAMAPDGIRRVAAAVYGEDRWPTEGKVWGVLKTRAGVDDGVKVGVEYPPDADRSGRVVTLGAGVRFAGNPEGDRRRLELLVRDALSYLHGGEPPLPVGIDVPSPGAPAPVEETTAGEAATTDGVQEEGDPGDEPGALPPVLRRTTYWRPGSSATFAFEPASTAGPSPATGRAVLDAVDAARSGLSLRRSPALADAPFDLSARRVLCIGDQAGRIDELWSHPRRVLRDLRFGVVDPGGDDDEILWLHADGASPSFTARPEGDTVSAVLDGVEVTLHLAVDRRQPALVALLALDAERPVDLVASWLADGRPAWPRDGDPVTLELGWDGGSRAVVWRDRGGGFAALAGFGLPVERRILGVAPGSEPPEASLGDPLPTPTSTLRLTVDPDEQPVVPFVVVGGSEGLAAHWRTYARLLQDPAAVWAAGATHYREVLTRTLDVTTPDPTFDEALRWAKVGVEAFRATTPGLGTGTVEAFPGPYGDGAGARPLQYTAAAAVWAARAADAYGGFTLGDESLRLLARYRGVDGAIFSELSPSWSLQYGADDATLLFLVGLERHLRATGDRQLLRLLWPAARAALEHGFRADRNGDQLVDGVGGLAIESGPSAARLHTGLDLAGLWGVALEAAGRLAGWAGDQELADRSRSQATTVRRLLNEEFWNAEDRTYYRGLAADGGFVAGRSVLPAVPLSFGLLDPGRATPSLVAFASSEFSTDWGVRLRGPGAPTDDGGAATGDGGPPTGDSVRPLLTGLVSLAEYTYHRPLAGFAHLTNVLRQVRHDNLGYIGGSLDGESQRPPGSASRQAMAESMAIIPAVEGLLGLRVDAMEETVTLIPHLPGGWDRVVASPVQIGDDAFRITILRSDESTEFQLERISGTRQIRTRLGVPVPREVPVSVDRDASSGVSIREEEVIGSPFDHAAVATVVPTGSPARVVFRHGAFPQVIPEPTPPEPGRPSVGLRPIHSTFRFGTLVVELEGMPGRTYDLAVSTPWPIVAVEGVPGARAVSPGPGRATIRFTLPGSGDRYQGAELVVSFDRR